MPRLKTGLTFKPLARGYYRCNQTGEKTKNPESYRRQKENSNKNHIPNNAKGLPRVKLDRFNKWKCPNEYWHKSWKDYNNYSKNTRVIATCDCGERVYITARE
jgi:hypothetical protein